MMNLEFGMANQYIIDLSLNAKRGQRTKVQQGWFAHKPPIGYLSNKFRLPDKPPIFPDPINFPIVKQMWNLLIQKRYSIEKLFSMVKEMGLKTHYNKIIDRSAFYRIFKNPFYYGHFYWNGELYPGKHEPMISKADFVLVQRIMSGKVYTRAKDHTFAFTGLMRCGECGASITAEEKFKPQKNGNTHHYVYYRCTKRINPKCSQQPIRREPLEEQILHILEDIRIPPEFHQWAIKYLKEDNQKEATDREQIIDSHNKCLNQCIKKIESLFNMRVNGEISAEEYTKKKDELIQEKEKYEELIADSNKRVVTWLERAEKLLDLAETAKTRFENGSLDEKREILEILGSLGSNLVLMNKILGFPDDNNLLIFRELAPEVKSLHNRLEPLQTIGSKTDWEAFYKANIKWRGGRDLNSRSSA